MEVSAVSSHSSRLQLKHSTMADDGKRPSEKGYRSTHTNGKPNLTNTSIFVNHGYCTQINKLSLLVFVSVDADYKDDSAAIAWHEERRKWIGDKDQHPPRMAKDPVIRYVNWCSFELWFLTDDSCRSANENETVSSVNDVCWSTSYEDLLSTNEPFAEPIPLPEMVDFLVDIWHDDGLFD